MTIKVVAGVQGKVGAATGEIASGLKARVLATVEAASREGAKAARAIIVEAGRVDTGRMRDSTVEFPAAETADGAEGGFHCRVPYAIYNEYGTIRMSGIHFMEKGAVKARRELIDGLSKIAGGNQK
jgi:hypothetical protein